MTVREILIQAGFRITSETSDFYRMKPLHRESGNDTCLSVSKKTGYFTDFGTNESGPLKKLIRLTTGGDITFEPVRETVDDLKEELQITFNQEEIKALLPSYQFYNKRGISNETLALFKSGFCQGGKLYNRFVFPIINPDGVIVGLSGRSVLSQQNEKWIKWKHLGRKNKWIYPYLWSASHIRDKSEIIIVESIGNMLALWEAGYKHTLVCFGTSLSKDLLACILAASPSRIILALDNDDKSNGTNPGQEASCKIRKELEKWFDTSKICSKVTPIGQDLSDLWRSGGQKSIDNWYVSSLG